MAAKKATLAKSIQDELTCAVCLDRFKNPKVLPCLHSFCAECLQGVVAGSTRKDRVSCPECRLEHTVPSKGFTNHFLLAKLVEHLTVHEGEGEDKKMVCGSGLDSNTAAGWCVDCHSYLCHQCLVSHKQQKITMSHKTLTLAEVKEGALTEVYQKHMCSEHEGEELKIYCRTCQDVICRDCTVITHKGHNYVFIKDAQKEIIQSLQQLLLQVKEKDVKFQAYISSVITAMAAKEQHFSRCEKQVNEYFDECIAKIQRHRALLLDKLHYTKVNDEKILVTVKEDLEFTEARLSSAAAFTEQLLSSGNTSDIAHLSKQTSKQLRSLVSLKKEHDISTSVCSFEEKGGPLDCDVNVVQVLEPAFVSQPGKVPHGLNQIDILATARPNISINTDSGEPCKVTEITPTGPSSWHVIYIIPAPPLTKKVHVTAETLGKTVMTEVQCTKKLAIGTRVVRGPDWRKGDKDGGPGSVGIVTHQLWGTVFVQWRHQSSDTDHSFNNFGFFEIKTEV